MERPANLHNPHQVKSILDISSNISPCDLKWSKSTNFSSHSAAILIESFVVQVVQGTCGREVRQWLINDDGHAGFAWRSQGSQTRSEGSCRENVGTFGDLGNLKTFNEINPCWANSWGRCRIYDLGRHVSVSLLKIDLARQSECCPFFVWCIRWPHGFQLIIVDPCILNHPS